MLVLAFDTAQGACSAAISRDGVLLAQCHEVMQRGHAEKLLPMVENIRLQAAVDYADLDLIAVTIGPGTFTGVRVGLAAARALALVHGTPLLGIGTLELLAQGALRMAAVSSVPSGAQMDQGSAVVAAIDARREELYAQVFDLAGAAVTQPTVGSMEQLRLDITALDISPGCIVGTGAELLQAAVPDWRVEPSIIFPDAAVLALAAPGLRARVSATAPSPLYLRAPDARLPGQKGPPAQPVPAATS
jgi:tRNA threonylcarbamoyladenosine biosynthesis protein TsaB